jgi:hypothetical protein
MSISGRDDASGPPNRAGCGPSATLRPEVESEMRCHRPVRGSMLEFSTAVEERLDIRARRTP